MRESTKRKILAYTSGVLAIAFAVSLGWGIYQYQLVQQYKLETENHYQRALNDLITTMNEVETSMAKVKIANTPVQQLLYLGETWKGSVDAVGSLGELPATEVGINYVDTLVNQVGDFCKTMSRKIASLEQMTPEEFKTFNDMHERIIETNRSLQKLANEFYAENLPWVDKSPGLLQKLGLGKNLRATAEGGESGGQGDQTGQEAQQQAQQQTPTSLRGGLQQLDASLQKYPPFSYQGELDKHIVTEPQGLPAGEINENKAVAAAKEFLQNIGYKDATPQVTGLTEDPLGGFNLTYKEAYLEVSKKGGVVTYFRDQREISDRKLDLDEVLKKATDTLAKIGWNLDVTSTQDLGSYVQIELVPTEQNVRLYPDKIRLTVATDNGQIVGYDAAPYYAYHHKRDLKPALSLDQAKAKLKEEFKILENRLAVISKIGTEEAFCYEFRGTAFGEEYLVYINAIDGSEEKISRVINTPTGKLIQ